MDGVEILTSTQVVTELAYDWAVFWIVFGIIFVVCLLIGIFSSLSDHNWDKIVVGGLIGLVLGGIVGGSFVELSKKPIAYETQYKVTISDKVSMTEFYEHYEVIEQDGKIFTVREKADD